MSDVHSDCEIVEVEPVVLRAPAEFTPGESWRRGWGETFMVRVHARCGIDGWGVAETQPDVGRALVEARSQRSFGESATATLGGLRELLLGRSAAALGPLWHALYEGTLVFGRRGAALQAISAVETACTDLLARRLGVDVATLLGGRFRDAVPAYASAVLPEDPREIDALAHYVTDAGYRAAKVGWGAFRTDDATVLALIERLRSELPPEIALAFDVGYEHRRGASETLRLVSALERYEPLWIEEPCHPDDLDGYRRLAVRANVPIAAGEACATAADFAELIAAGVEILQPDLSRCGGFTVAREVAALARVAHRRVVPHAWQNGVLLAATLQLCATLPYDTFVETSVAAGPLRELAMEPLALAGGAFALPAGPGLGVAPDPDTIERLRA